MYVRGAELVKLDADPQQWDTITRVSDVGERYVVRGERVREHDDFDTAFGDLAERLHTGFAGHEIRRRNNDLSLGLRDAIHDIHVDAHRARCFDGRRRYFLRLVGERNGGPPNKTETSRVEISSDRRAPEHILGWNCDRHHLFAVVDEMVEVFSRLVRVRQFAEDDVDRIGLATVPVCVEDGGKLRHDGTDDQDVHVDEVARRASRKVFVGDVPAAHDGNRTVRDEELVVHPVVEPPEFPKRRRVSTRHALARTAKRIEEAHLDVGKGRQPAKHRVSAHGVQIVDQQPHAHAAQRRVAQVAHQEATGAIVLDQVVLDVERVAGPADKLDPGIERVETIRQKPKPRQRRFGAGVLRDPD